MEIIMHTNFFRSWILLFALSSGAYAEFRLANIFLDNMVLQREMPVKIWGFGTDGETVEISFDRQTEVSRA